MARFGSTVSPLGDLQHASLHWQNVAHHHHDDGSYHPDDSSESVQHVVIDHVNVLIALTALPAHGLPCLASVVPGGWQDAAAPNPALDGLLRPPRPRA